MDKFQASNGYTILARENATVDWWSSDGVHSGVIQVFTHSQVWKALREFFQAERDEELGRWRWPENPEYVVIEGPRSDYRNQRTVVVVNERTLDRWWLNEGVMSAREDRPENRHAARAFFEAHPEPKPWHDAKPGEVWELTFSEAGGGGAVALIFHKGKFRNPQYVSRVPLDDPTITAGRRIWPVEES